MLKKIFLMAIVLPLMAQAEEPEQPAQPKDKHERWLTLNQEVLNSLDIGKRYFIKISNPYDVDKVVKFNRRLREDTDFNGNYITFRGASLSSNKGYDIFDLVKISSDTYKIYSGDLELSTNIYNDSSAANMHGNDHPSAFFVKTSGYKSATDDILNTNLRIVFEKDGWGNEFLRIIKTLPNYSIRWYNYAIKESLKLTLDPFNFGLLFNILSASDRNKYGAGFVRNFFSTKDNSVEAILNKFHPLSGDEIYKTDISAVQDKYLRATVTRTSHLTKYKVGGTCYLAHKNPILHQRPLNNPNRIPLTNEDIMIFTHDEDIFTFGKAAKTKTKDGASADGLIFTTDDVDTSNLFEEEARTDMHLTFDCGGAMGSTFKIQIRAKDPAYNPFDERQAVIENGALLSVDSINDKFAYNDVNIDCHAPYCLVAFDYFDYNDNQEKTLTKTGRRGEAIQYSTEAGNILYRLRMFSQTSEKALKEEWEEYSDDFLLAFSSVGSSERQQLRANLQSEAQMRGYIGYSRYYTGKIIGDADSSQGYLDNNNINYSELQQSSAEYSLFKAYELSNYSAPIAPLSIGAKRSVADLGNNADKITGLDIAFGYKLLACKEINYKACKFFTGKVDLSDNQDGFDDSISSYKILPVGVEGFTGANSTGTSFLIDKELSYLGQYKNKIKSVVISDGYALEVFGGDNFEGQRQIYVPSANSNKFNISGDVGSLKVFKILEANNFDFFTAYLDGLFDSPIPYVGSSLDNADLKNNSKNISGLDIKKGFSVKAYPSINFSGAPKTYTGKVDIWQDDNEFNDKMASYKVVPSNGRFFTAYRDAYFGSPISTIGINIEDADLGENSTNISGLDIKPEFAVVAYPEPNFTGVPKVYTGKIDMALFDKSFNDKMASYKIIYKGN